jgi:hypothetical protein
MTAAPKTPPTPETVTAAVIAGAAICSAGRPSSSTDSVLWFAVGVWMIVKNLTPKELTEAVLAADAVLEKHPPGMDVRTEIPHFGQCSYARCTAIVAVFICMRSKSDHVDSPILAAAREAKILADAEPTPCRIANAGLEHETFK